MPRVRQRASYCHLTQTERERILELRDLGLSLRQIAMRVGRDASTVQRCVFQCLGEQRQTGLKASTAQTDRQTRRMARSDPICTASETEDLSVACDVRRRLHDTRQRTRRPAAGSIDLTPPLSKAIMVQEKNEKVNQKEEKRRKEKETPTTLTNSWKHSQGGGYDLDIFTENPDEDLLCSICHGVLRCPVMISCGHIFCRKCILQWLKRQQTCPCCRTEVRGKLYVQMHKLKRKINRLQVKCPNEQNGCPALFPLPRSEEHAETCAFGLVACCNEGCPAQVLRKDVGDHSQSCKYWSEMCHMRCGTLLNPANRDEHNCYMELKETYNKQLHKLRQKARRIESLSSQMSRQIQLLGESLEGAQASASTEEAE